VGPLNFKNPRPDGATQTCQTQRSLTPGFDQTRSAGLVVLPGAFVGMLLGGATLAEAAQIQLLVLTALAVAAVVAAATTA
jgi:putative ABC transport system permease protein